MEVLIYPVPKSFKLEIQKLLIALLENNTILDCVISPVKQAIMVLDLFAGQKRLMVGSDVEWALPKRQGLVLKLLSVK